MAMANACERSGPRCDGARRARAACGAEWRFPSPISSGLDYRHSYKKAVSVAIAQNRSRGKGSGRERQLPRRHDRLGRVLEEPDRLGRGPWLAKQEALDAVAPVAAEEVELVFRLDAL